MLSLLPLVAAHSDAASTCKANWGGGSSTCVTAVAVCLAESSGNCTAKYINSGGSIDRGLWQINNEWHSEVSDSCAYDCSCNGRSAYTISSSGNNWSPWATYKSGAYRSHLAEAESACGATAPSPRMTEAEFRTKWADVLVDHRRKLQGPPPGPGPSPGGNPFQGLINAIEQITSAWQSIVSAFKSSYSEEIADKEFANGWSEFKESTKVFKGAGLEYSKSTEFFNDIQSMIAIPADYKDDFNDQIKWIQFFDNLTWSEHNTQFASGKGGSDTMFTMYARNRQADQKIDVLFMTIAQEFKLADNYFVISESKSILGGLFSSTKLKFKEIPAGITTEELMFVSDYFSLLAYQQIALAEGIDEPPDPSFPPPSAPAVVESA